MTPAMPGRYRRGSRPHAARCARFPGTPCASRRLRRVVEKSEVCAFNDGMDRLRNPCGSRERLWPTFDRHARAGFRIADPHCEVMDANHRRDNAQAEARACNMARLLAAVEQLQHRAALAGRDARSVVDDIEPWTVRRRR